MLFDVDGVLRHGHQAMPAAGEVQRTLPRRNIPYCLLSNNSTHSRASLLVELRGIGLEAGEGRLFNAVTATATWVAKHHPGKRGLVLVAPDAVSAFRAAGVDIIPDGDAGSDERSITIDSVAALDWWAAAIAPPRV